MVFHSLQVRAVLILTYILSSFTSHLRRCHFRATTEVIFVSESLFIYLPITSAILGMKYTSLGVAISKQERKSYLRISFAHVFILSTQV